MDITVRSDKTVRTITFQVVDGPVVRCAGPRHRRADTVTLTIINGVLDLDNVRVYGPLCRKDGTPTARTSRQLYGFMAADQRVLDGIRSYAAQTANLLRLLGHVEIRGVLASGVEARTDMTEAELVRRWQP